MRKAPAFTLITGLLLAPVANLGAANPPRTLVPLNQPLNEIQDNIKKAKERAAKDLENARAALRIAAPGLPEMLENLAAAAEQLEADTEQLADDILKDKKPGSNAAKAMLEEQQNLNDRIQSVKQALRRDANAQDMRLSLIHI